MLNTISFFFSEVDFSIFFEGLSFSCFAAIFFLLECFSPVLFLFFSQESPEGRVRLFLSWFNTLWFDDISDADVFSDELYQAILIDEV